MNIRSYDLSGDDVLSLVTALEGNNTEKTKWLTTLRDWTSHRNRQMEINDLIEKWLVDFARRTGAHIARHDFATDEENLMDWVYYQMEYTGGIQWNHETQRAYINKYSSSRPLLSDEHTQELLNFVSNKVCR
jgi:hypothetical protein